MSIDVENAYRITERISFPRLIGSEGEKKAISIVKEEFEKIGYNPVSEAFETDFSNWVLSQYAFPLVGILLLINAIVFIFFPWISIIPSIIIVLAASFFTRLGDIELFKFGKKYQTENIFGKLDAPDPKFTVIFMGHYDSKSQVFPMIVRIIVLIVTVFGGLITALVTFIGGIIKTIMFFLLGVNPVSNPLILGWNAATLTLGIMTCIVASLNYFNKVGNNSPGAIDNGVSVATVLELARYFKEAPHNKVNFIFLCPSSEELNLGGAREFIKQHKSDLDKQTTYFINFDGIGTDAKVGNVTSYGFPRKVASRRLKELYDAAAEELDIPYYNVYLPVGAWSDFMPALAAGYQACWLESMGALKNVHTRTDDMSKVSKKGIKEALQLTIRVIEKLVED